MADDEMVQLLAQERLRAEIEKLRAETTNLRRPPWRTPAALVSLLTGLVALLGAGFTYQLNTIRAERLRDDIARLEERRDELLRDIEQAKVESELVAKETRALRETLVRLKAALAAMSPATPLDAATIRRAQEAADSTRANIDRADVNAAERKERLEALGERVEKIGPPRLRR